MMKHLNTFLDILSQPPLYDDSCEILLTEFSDEEVEELANVSYAYWIVNLKAKERLPVDARRNSALKEIRRHYVGEGRNCAKALPALREAIVYRRKYSFNILRSCCYDSCGDDLSKKYRSFVLQDLKMQPMVVRGIDNHSRTIVYKSPRTSSENNNDADEAFLITQIYTAERAIATNEFTSKSKEEKLTVVFNFCDYSRKNSPSTSTILTLTKMLQRVYPERLGVLIIISPPFWIRTAFNMVWPLLSTATTEKIKLPSDQEAVDDAFHELVGGNEKLVGMLANGDIASVDLIDYTKQPFYCQFQ